MNAQFLGFCDLKAVSRSCTLLRWCKWMVLLGSIAAAINTAYAKENELVILTTFSREPLLPLIEEFSKQYQGVDVQVVHRRAQSSIQLLNKSYIQNIDVVLSSSPFLMQHLANSNKLATLPAHLQPPEWLKPYMLPPTDKVVTIGYSGAGLVWNRDYLSLHHLPTPTSFTDLANFIYFDHITMSTPTRSGTTQLMVESILAKYGWQQGWRILLNVGANLGTISSRSFGVSDYVAKGQFGIGPTIDSYASILERKFEHVQFRYDESFTLMPTYVAQVSLRENDQYAKAFIDLLMSKSVQTNMDSNDFSKHAINDKSLFNEAYTQLSMASITHREELVNLLFEIAITKRLPQLKDTWLAINHAKTKYAHNEPALKLIENIETRVFSLPVTETELAVVYQSWQKISVDDVQYETNSAAISMQVAELTHRWKMQLALTLEEALSDLKNLDRVDTP
ncbi:ABC transporter substrate-binding protein [Vibrio anguillarum]|uniref:ABC transporter substrate-binding protein n=1 Tax=Vibrio anguillarum TaxID=55601 RepID=UPI000B53FD31|nr:ABC transporter substrate-binding protein [Vibrio anguillarum]ASG09398.1 ABC transporter substrate-binding protein [Vibrio anguillarum]